MAPKSKFGLIIVACLLTINIVWHWQTSPLTPAPNAIFKGIKGETIALANLKGKPILVTFWATDCPNCIEEIPHLISLHHQFSPQGLIIIAVAMDYDPPNHVLTMTEAKQIPYAVALDPLAEHAQAFGNVELTPTTFLIDKNGMIVMQKTGRLDLSALEEQLKNME